MIDINAANEDKSIRDYVREAVKSGETHDQLVRRDAFTSVIERLEMRKVDFLDSARKFPCAGMEYSDHMELLGRAYGIDIALSYLREEQ